MSNSCVHDIALRTDDFKALQGDCGADLRAKRWKRHLSRVQQLEVMMTARGAGVLVNKFKTVRRETRQSSNKIVRQRGTSS